MLWSGRIGTVSYTHLQKINKQGKTILLIEQNATMALSIAHRGYVLESGRVVMHDSGTNLLHDERVRLSLIHI